VWSKAALPYPVPSSWQRPAPVGRPALGRQHTATAPHHHLLLLLSYHMLLHCLLLLLLLLLLYCLLLLLLLDVG
jgi:hypothetical protein